MRTDRRTDGRTDGHDKANSNFANAPKYGSTAVAVILSYCCRYRTSNFVRFNSIWRVFADQRRLTKWIADMWGCLLLKWCHSAERLSEYPLRKVLSDPTPKGKVNQTTRLFRATLSFLTPRPIRLTSSGGSLPSCYTVRQARSGSVRLLPVG
jgi:hypothetical protein